METIFRNHIYGAKHENTIATKLSKLLALVRKHLDMDVAFISEFISGERVFKFVNNQSTNKAVTVGNSDPIEDTYCKKIADNQLDPIIPDTKNHPITKVMPVTEKLNIGAYIGVPIILSCGNIYGTFCCFKSHADDSLNNRDLSFLKVIAEMATELIEKKFKYDQLHHDAKSAIEQVIKNKSIKMYFQPIFCLATNKVAGYESLSRFFTEPYKTPDVWFNQAAQLGLSEPLEMLAIKTTLDQIDQIDQFDHAKYISINTSPAHILSGALAKVLQNVNCQRIVVELTEHTKILDYQAVRIALQPLRDKGIRLAIDDAGAGFASFQHILELEADIIKLDITLTQNINKERSKYLLAKALCGFAKAINCIILAEGIETKEELNALRNLGVDKVQGYLLGRPAPVADAICHQKTTLVC